jgi:Phosphotransferase enzyme family
LIVSADEPEIEIELQGGVANAGAVVRIGETVRRPLPTNHATLHALQRHLRDAGFDGAPEPLGVDDEGREMLAFIPGDVPVPPYPAWSLTDVLLASVARLQRRYHEAVASFAVATDATWSQELSDPRGGPLVAHNDVCPENVVVRDGEAVALLDFEYAAPGTVVWDLAGTARMWVPLGDPAFMNERADLDHLGRLRLFADEYGLLTTDRPALVDAIVERQGLSRRFLRRHVGSGHPGFVEMWEAIGGQTRMDANDRWYEVNHEAMLRALT